MSALVEINVCICLIHVVFSLVLSLYLYKLIGHLIQNVILNLQSRVTKCFALDRLQIDRNHYMGRQTSMYYAYSQR